VTPEVHASNSKVMSMSDDESIRAPDIWLGRGFWKLAYVTRDRDRAIDRLREEVGIERFELHEPTFGVAMADGRVGTATTRVAFSLGRPTTIELIEPVAGLVDCYAEALGRANGSELTLHHVGLMVDDVDAMMQAAVAKGLSPTAQSAPGDAVRWIFYASPLLDHYVEHLEQREWIVALQTGPVAPPP
jgi:catechol 2,3-dioxygenase-like lactoylglutathione lyase family enzyme